MSSEKSENPHFSKLHFNPKWSQSKRRELTLEWQKKRRDELLDKIRQLEGDSGVSESETDDGLDFLQNSKAVAEAKKNCDDVDGNGENKVAFKKNKYKYKKRSKPPPTRVMLSEWLITKPDDFEDKWIGVLCPAGRRTIVVASRGRTRVYSRTGEHLGSFVSLLPGGRRVAGSRGVTLLDCIWSDEAKVFYVLDLICWNSHSCMNCDTEYRQFFLASKFSENQELISANGSNHIAFMPLPYFVAEDLPKIMTSVYPPFPDLIDGVLFVHKEAFYISEVNPLCLWVRVTDVEKRLGISVNPELMAKEAPIKEHKNRKQNMELELESESAASVGEAD